MTVGLRAALVLGLTCALGCGNKKGQVGQPLPATSSSATQISLGDAGVADALSPPADSAADPALPTLRALAYTESDFVESDRNRDPFRAYAPPAASAVGSRDQRDIKLAQYTVDELKLVAIVRAGEGSRAMFVDPTGNGTIVYRGSFLGRPEIVRVGGPNGQEYALPWRVDRIRDGDVVLTREDPSRPSAPPATRVILLHAEGEEGGP